MVDIFKDGRNLNSKTQTLHMTNHKSKPYKYNEKAVLSTMVREWSLPCTRGNPGSRPSLNTQCSSMHVENRSSLGFLVPKNRNDNLLTTCMTQGKAKCPCACKPWLGAEHHWGMTLLPHGPEWVIWWSDIHPQTNVRHCFPSCGYAF